MDANPRRRSAVRPALFAVGVLVLSLLGWQAAAFPYFAWDLGGAQWFQSVELPGFETFMRTVSWLGSGWTPYFLVAAVCLALWAAGKSWEAAVLLGRSGSGRDTEQRPQGND